VSSRKYIHFHCISIHTSSPPVHNSKIPLIMLHHEKGHLSFSFHLVSIRRPFHKHSSTPPPPTHTLYFLSLDGRVMQTACVQRSSTVYTYHIHLISPNEISTDLLFTMHHWAASARHTHTHTHTHMHQQHCHQHQSHSVSGRERSSLFSWSRSHSALRSQTDPWGLMI